MRILYFFTNTYPYDIGEQWKTNELQVLKRNFEVTVIPFYSHSKEHATIKIKGINYQEPLFENLPKISIINRFLLIVFCKYILIFISEFLSSKVYKNKTRFIQWISASYKIIYLSKNKRLKDILIQADENTLLYFFWGKETSEIIPVLKTKAKIIVRYHGYDLYEERNYNYIPYREQQLKKIHTALFVSEQGRKYLTEQYKNISFKAKVFRLGTREEGISKISTDKLFRIFSCSSVIPIKRVELIASAVLKLKFPVEWTHIGGGKLIEKLNKICENPPDYIRINFTGQINSSEVKKYYVDNFSDLFINTSTTEGVPVSIMEAMSAAIPIFATNVGGTSEIVDDKIGKLLPPVLTSTYLAKQITNFYNLSQEQKLKFRMNSYNSYKKLCMAEIKAEQLAKYLHNL